ncbi:hypothetical protein [Lysinibacillus pakistanensis]|uniref:HK97 gp10 family phage protein n=1 Tax=Lysinibacillus pakistanensis TaxID=759811 RepID=A0ABX6DF66_9BACI|nr:hypothetical protein GDS87_11970 [Lysinibacillus pakistanensis]
MMNVMKRAWEIAKEGAAKFGGSVKSYFSTSLKMAWAEMKEVTKTYVEQMKDVYAFGYEEDRLQITFKEWKRNTDLHRLYINIETNKGRSLNTIFISLKDGKVGSQGRNATFQGLGDKVAKIVEAHKNDIIAKYVA